MPHAPIIENAARDLSELNKSDPVRRHTAEWLRDKIDRRTIARLEEDLEFLGGDQDLARRHFSDRINDLKEEWDMERAIELLAGTIALSGIATAAGTRRWRYLALPAMVLTFLIQHATMGWCPPVPALRRLGFRTRAEIDVEKSVLKEVRGDWERRGPLPVTVAIT
jgi:hypothetical protein